ncbi:MAG: YjjW family glycine radical enzyme activase [Clostridiaceae bacterium]|nr:YjjW family glycine radical enzyme activase [Clostridiaceae bacterium]
MKAIVNRILPFSSVDGPGNRTSIFFQGCNFNCLYCHNPETINICNHCGICVMECKFSALWMNSGEVIWDKVLCQNCDVCLGSCPHNSTPKALEMTVEQVLLEIRKTRKFISGITVSGGECTLQSEFLLELFKEVKKMGLTTFVDTNGSIPLYQNEALLKVTDKVMLDVKAYNEEEHKMLTGMGNQVVLKNLKELAKKDKLYEIRTVIVPEVLNNYLTVDRVSKWISEVNPALRYKLIKYRTIGVRIDMLNSYTPSEEIIKELITLANRNGCDNVICI